MKRCRFNTYIDFKNYTGLILSRVPAKSLTKLRTTCKRWYALFRDSSFVKKNLDKATMELMLHSNYDVHSISVNLHGTEDIVDPSMEFKGKLGRLNDPRKLNISGVFHCHGLVLCSTIGNVRLVVWNPSTGQTRWIKPRTCYRYDEAYDT
ncbi:putative F-box/kelch-repeat protein [Cardamine amara subsp. amara]|uniref:F-box/kelch-repeat protein n=1 Tax=Cardamine amara subsp. amara TaxID=228776 RepID=A0ABD1A794_CARAN